MQRDPECEYLVGTTYSVKEENKKEFEMLWSHTAQLAQRQPGYEWTKTYKALEWDGLPFQYIALMMWDEDTCYKRFMRYNETRKELMKRMTDLATEHPCVYKIIVDDSVRRIIE